MAEIYLLRHAHSVANEAGLLAGRTEGVGLSKIGLAQRHEIAKTLAEMDFVAIYSSPLLRCRETIAPLSERMERRVRIAADFNEMDYGDWSGRKLSQLSRLPLWRKIQRHPSEVTFPNGESFKGAQRRVRRGLNEISERHKKGKVLIVTHGDIIKIALQETLAGDLDDFQKIVVDPASLSVIDWKARLMISANLPLTKRRRVKGKKSRTTLGGGSNV